PALRRRLSAMRQAVAEARAWSDQYVDPNPQYLPPGLDVGIGHASVISAWYEFANVLTWSRAIEERMDRAPLRGRGIPNHTYRQGLINAVQRRRLKKRLERLLDDLRAGPVGAARYLSNFTLHAAMVQYPNSGARVRRTGEVYMPIPDTPSGPVFHADLFSWNNGRDAIEFAEQL